MLVEGLDIRFLITTRTRPELVHAAPRGLRRRPRDRRGRARDDRRRSRAGARRARRRRRPRPTDAHRRRVARRPRPRRDDAATSTSARAACCRTRSTTSWRASCSRRATPETQDGTDAAGGRVDPDVEVARILLDTRTDDVLEDAVARGLVAVTERKSLLMHPLLRELLIRRFGEADDETRERTALARADGYFRAHRWDEALACRRGRARCRLRHGGNRSRTRRPPQRLAERAVSNGGSRRHDPREPKAA